MYRLERPNMAVNDPRVGARGQTRRFRMWNTWNISSTETRDHIIEWVADVANSADGGKLKHLVLSCHGAPGELALGEGFDSSSVSQFAGWNGLVDKIWVPSCNVAAGRTGHAFCSAMAAAAGCYLVVSTEIQCEAAQSVPYDMMTSFEGLVLSYGPDGTITWRGRNVSSWRQRTLMDRILGGAGQCVQVPD